MGIHECTQLCQERGTKAALCKTLLPYLLGKPWSFIREMLAPGFLEAVISQMTKEVVDRYNSKSRDWQSGRGQRLQ